MANTTWNPSDKTAGLTLSGGNLVVAWTIGSGQGVRAVDRQAGGKFYWEVTPTGSLSNLAIGVANGNVPFSSISAGDATTSIGCAWVQTGGANGTLGINGSQYISVVPLVLGSPVCIALDLNSRLIWFRIGAAGNWNGVASANPATGSGGYVVPFGTTLATYPVALWNSSISGSTQTANFGDTAFVGAVPAGFTSGFTAGAAPANVAALSSIARETLVSNPSVAYLGGIARETLMSGNSVDGITRTKSSLQAQLTITGGVTTIAGGAGGGGAAGFFGPGEFGQSGVYDGTGGYGGAGDNYLTSRQLTPSLPGHAGIEWDGTYGSGSGGSGGSSGGSGHGGNGGVGGLYGGGGGGGGSGLAGGGLGALGGEGVIYLEYDPGTGPIVIILTKDSPTTFTIPLDWNTSNNKLIIVGAGGCGTNGGLTTGGAGGGGGSVIGAINTSLYTPGQVIPIDIPSAAQVCAGTKGNTVFGSNSAAPGINGNGSTAGTPSVPIPPVNGGIPSGPPSSGGGPSTGGTGGSVSTLVAARIQTMSQMWAPVVPGTTIPMQTAVSG